MLVPDGKTGHTCLVFTCMEVVMKIVSRHQKVHRVGNFGIPFFHDWIQAFLILAGAL